jgi:hypothetical protein
MAILDFQLRAWRTSTPAGIELLVHSSPAGGMRTPLHIACDFTRLDALRPVASEQWRGGPGMIRRVTDLGLELGGLLFREEVAELLRESLARLERSDLLRVRLCFDEHLIDLPWEFAYIPESGGRGVLSGFLVRDRRVSLVREPPFPASGHEPLTSPGRIAFVGAMGPGESDPWHVVAGHNAVAVALKEVKDYLRLDSEVIRADRIETCLDQPAVGFQYFGHTDIDENREGYLVREVLVPPECLRSKESYVLHRDVEPFFCERLTELFRKAGTRFVILTACNSGRWPVVQPILRAGVKLVVGMQGTVSIAAGTAFCAQFYAALAVGLSVDEAVLKARMHVLDAGVSPHADSCEWGAFMVYMPTAEEVLLPRPAGERKTAQDRDEIHRSMSHQASKRSLRQAIVQAFSPDELEILCSDLRGDLTEAGQPSDGVELVPGQKEYQAMELIEALDRRGNLQYLEQAVHRARPNLVW